MKLTFLTVAIGTLMATIAPAVAAPVVGDALTCTASGLSCSNSRATMNSGAEFTGNFGAVVPMFSFDFSAGQLKISNAAGLDYGMVGGFEFSFSDATDPFTQVTMLSNSGFSGLSQSDFALNGNVLTFASNSSFSATKGAELTLRLNAPGPVPEPASWAMMILGMGAIGFAVRRRLRLGRAAVAL